MLCTHCGFENPEGTKFCGNCGQPFKHRCSKCQSENPPGFKFCGNCGESLTKPPARRRDGSEPGGTAIVKPVTKVRSPGEPERRQVTVLFCDLVGSTALSERLDPEVLREVIHAYQSTCAKVIRQYDGHIARYFGDGILVYFGYPVAHGDDAQRAVRTGLGIVESMTRLNARLEEDMGVWLRVRLGIHTGIVVAGDIDRDQGLEAMAIIGETPNIAARLEGFAEPDTVVVSSATRRLVEGLFNFREMKTLMLKGISKPMEIYQVLGERQSGHFKIAARTGSAPLMGREREMETLMARWERVRAGAGQVVFLSGEAGVGKSRLVQAVKENLANEPHARQEYFCSPYHQNSALYPVIDLLARWLKFHQDDTPLEKLEKLESVLAQNGSNLPEVLPLLASLLSLPSNGRFAPLNLDPKRQRRLTLEALLRILLGIASEQPVLFVVEDLHWSDPSTLELLNLVIGQVPTVPILALLTFRPTFSLPWSARSYFTQLTLSNLAPQEVEGMINRLAAGKTLPVEVVGQIVDKTDGVPLFVEELTKMVLDAGVLQELEDRYELSGPLPPLAIPSTLRDALSARLDRLASVKELAQLGATIGRRFTFELLHAISSYDEENLGGGLAQLVDAELLYQQGVVPQATYTFKHALIQEAAYRSMLRSKRQQVHQGIARVLEEQFPETVEIQPELLAQHYTAAGLIERAIAYWKEAGQRATGRSAHLEAVAHLRKGLELLETLPDSPERTQHELALLVALGAPLQATMGLAAPEVQEIYSRAREICQEVDDPAQLFPVTWGLWLYYSVRAEHHTAHDLGEQLWTLATHEEDPDWLMLVHRALGCNLFWRGEFVPALEHFEQVIAGYDPQRHHPLAATYGGSDVKVVCLYFSSLASAWLGYLDRANDMIDEAIALAKAVADPYSLAAASLFAAWLYASCRKERATMEMAEVTIDISTDLGSAFWLAGGKTLRGWALAASGRVEKGIEGMCQGLDDYKATGAGVFRSYCLALIAETYGKAGQVEDGLSALAEALAIVEETGERFWEAELYRVQGELLLARGEREAEVEASYQRAMAIAREQGAKSLELRAAMSLVRLWGSQGLKEGAREMLAEMYDWFTEGLDTPDLKETQRLVDELS